MVGTGSQMANTVSAYFCSNMDETPTVWGINPKFLFQTVNSGGRAAAPESDERARITTNVCVSADGSSLPPSFIIKCSTEALDQSRIQVLDTLLADPEFNTDGKWTKSTRRRTMTVKKKAREREVNRRCKSHVTHFSCFDLLLQWVTQGSKKGETIEETYIRPFLRHPDGMVVWAHPTAYQDTPGLAMWCDLVMGPARVKSGRRRWLLVWDNVKAHAVNSVLSVFNEWGISVRFLPKDMTDILQPVDLVPNGPIKAHIRKERCAKLYDYFQEWRVDAMDAERRGVPLPAYLPPPATMAGAIALIASIFRGHFAEEKYMQGLQRCFIGVGLAPQHDGRYTVYTDHKRGLARASKFRVPSSVTEMPGALLLDDVEFEERTRGVDEVASGGGPFDGASGEAEPLSTSDKPASSCE